MNLRSCLVIGAFMVELSAGVTARAQGLLGQMFSAPAVDEDTTATTRSESEPAQAAKPKPKPKPPKKIVWRAPANPPLPPPRPWADAEATFDVATQQFVMPAIVSSVAPAAQAPIAEAPHSSPDILPAGLQSRESPSARAPAPRARSMVLIVRAGVRGPGDLQGRRIATGLTSEAPDELRRMVEESAGVSVSAVAIGWSAGLTSLARGEIDGVLLSLGPRVSASETEGVTLAGYQLLEIPIASAAP